MHIGQCSKPLSCLIWCNSGYYFLQHLDRDCEYWNRNSQHNQREESGFLCASALSFPNYNHIVCLGLDSKTLAPLISTIETHCSKLFVPFDVAQLNLSESGKALDELRNRVCILSSAARHLELLAVLSAGVGIRSMSHVGSFPR